ncbi:hypothetical protein OKW98_11835 [Pseudomonas sp. KU26590]|uniref:hypothetical protein n=1 Tax=Pseudomonas sp. KU26590 TaxID=2991051 RepID=UPI00223CFEFD|nr:hypothetical protein [Pseudomonas sp. KU26590]UZJ62350.1 hypothetical protein OKW98_11835 [Pseudomonas sp. KU26590]
MATNNQSKMAARYGEPDASALLAWNDIIDQLLDHRSVRAFTAEGASVAMRSICHVSGLGLIGTTKAWRS